MGIVTVRSLPEVIVTETDLNSIKPESFDTENAGDAIQGSVVEADSSQVDQVQQQNADTYDMTPDNPSVAEQPDTSDGPQPETQQEDSGEQSPPDQTDTPT